MLTRIHLLVVGLLCASLTLAACQSAPPPFVCKDAIGCVTIVPADPIKLGIMQVLTGDLKGLGIDQQRGIELAIQAKNDTALGHKIAQIPQDALCSPEGGTTGALKLIADGQIVAIIGPTCSGSATTASKLVSEAGLVMVSSSATTPGLTSVGGVQGTDWHIGFLRTAHNDAMQGRAAATFAFQKLGIKKAATINDGDAYAQGLTAVFSQAFKEMGGQIVLETAVNKGDTDMQPLLTAVANSGAELVFMPIFPPEALPLVQQAKKNADLKNISLMGADGVFVNEFVNTIGDAGTGMYFVGPSQPIGANFDTFVANYKEQYKEPPTTLFTSASYDAANLLLAAIEKVAVKDADGTLHIGRQALREALYSTKDFQGLTAKITCDKFGDCGTTVFKIMQLAEPSKGMEALSNNILFTYTPGK